MTTTPIAKSWYLLLAANDSLRDRAAREPHFFALPCDTLEDLTTQLALFARPAPRARD